MNDSLSNHVCDVCVYVGRVFIGLKEAAANSLVSGLCSAVHRRGGDGPKLHICGHCQFLCGRVGVEANLHLIVRMYTLVGNGCAQMREVNLDFSG